MVARVWIGVGLTALVGIGVAARLGGAEEGGRTVARSGMRAHVDPATGRFLPRPAAPAPVQPLPARPRLAEVPAPGGGTMVRLDDRFRSTMVATVDADGAVHLGCTTSDHSHGPTNR